MGSHNVGVISRPPTQSIPDAPGSYQFLDSEGRVLYVGKARSLRQRLSSYFQDRSNLAPRTVEMLEHAESVTWTEVSSEVEALILEWSLIQAHRPRYNVRLTDDKSYPFIAVDVSDPWPSVRVVRGAKKKGVRYFGPYAQVKAMRLTVGELQRCFLVRNCSTAKFNRHQRLGSPCLLYHIERCAGPCVGVVDADVYGEYVSELISFLEGDTKSVEKQLEVEMREAASRRAFEQAARLRDRLQAVRLSAERQQVVMEKEEDLDVFGVADDELGAAVSVLVVRHGRVVGNPGFTLEKVEELEGEALVGRVLEEFYTTSGVEVPGEVVVPSLPSVEDMEVLSLWLAGKRGKKVVITTRSRGVKKALVDIAQQNAAQSLSRARMRRASDLNARSKALEALRDALGLPFVPLRIECYDMSHLQGTDYVGSMVVMEDGLAVPREYRRFKIKTIQGNDDFAAMKEVLRRRLAKVATRSDSLGARNHEDPRDSRFHYQPQLLLLDGGKGQLGVGVEVLEELGLSDRIAVASLAKRLEEVFVPGRSDPIVIERPSDALYLLQQARDEAHRFAIGYHRKLRSKRATKSQLLDIPGLGPRRLARLRKELGGQRALESASLEDLLSLSWLPDSLARALFEALHGQSLQDDSGSREVGTDGGEVIAQ